MLVTEIPSDKIPGQHPLASECGPKIDRRYATQTEWKSALRISDTSWLGIGQYLGALVSTRLGELNLTTCDLTNALRQIGNTYIVPAFVEEYLAGNASLGCFFPQICEGLGLDDARVFPSTPPEDAKLHWEMLLAYLKDSRNKDALVSLLACSPGPELREHMRRLLSEKRVQAQTVTVQGCLVGCGAALSPFESELLREIDASLQGRKLLPSTVDADVTATAQHVLAPSSPERARLVEFINQQIRSGACDLNLEPIAGDDQLVIQPAVLRGKAGFTLDVYPGPSSVDNRCAGENGTGDGLILGLAAWREAYTQGTFSSVADVQVLINLAEALGMGSGQLVPMRELSEAARYELHQRWACAGGRYLPGKFVGSEEALRELVSKRADPVGRTGFEEGAFRINSSSLPMFGLLSMLPELLAESELGR